MNSQHFYVITGAPGAGKSTLLAALGNLGYSIVPEVARAIVQEQEKCGGSLLPAVDRQGFFEELLIRNVRAHQSAQVLKSPVFFDRGIPECLGHMRRLGLSVRPGDVEMAEKHRYATTVFVAEPWPGIYVYDDERHTRFERATRSYEATIAAYTEAGYETCVIPKLTVQERVAFVLAQLEKCS